MDRKALSSSNIASVAYDEDTRVLEVEFLSGAVYRYYAVEAQTYEGLVGAESPGGYLSSSIKGRYRYERVS